MIKPNRENNEEISELIASTMEREKNNLFRYGYYQIGSKNDTEDIMQDLFLRLCRKAYTLPQSESELKCYIFRSMQNACCDYLRHRKVTLPMTCKTFEKAVESLKDISAEEFSPQNPNEEYRLIQRLLNTLPQEQSETIRLRIYSECSFKEIAEIMQIPITTAKSRFKYGIDKLREALEASK